MEKILSVFRILMILNGCIAGPRRMPKHERIAENQRILDVYYKTDPFGINHSNRMKAQLEKSDIFQKKWKKVVNLRELSLCLISKKCKTWKDVTGWNEERTDKELANIYAATKTDGPPDREARMRERLLGVDPMFRRIDPEIIRSVVHNWYRHHVGALGQESTDWPRQHLADLLYIIKQVECEKNSNDDEIVARWIKTHPNLNQYSKTEILNKIRDLPHSDFKPTAYEKGNAQKRYRTVFEPKYGLKKNSEASIQSRIWSRQEQTDLLHTYREIQFGDGSVYDRLAKKWRQIHPELSNYSKYTLVNKAYDLIRTNFSSSPKEMEKAKEKYERVFTAGTEQPSSPKVKKRINWTREQSADLKYLFDVSEKHKISDFENYWQIMHPELDSLTRRHLSQRATTLKKTNFILTAKEKKTADIKFRRVRAQIQHSQPNEMFVQQGELIEPENFHEQEFQQRSPNSMVHSPSLHDGDHLTNDDWEYLRTVMNSDASHHPQDLDYSHSSHHYGSDSSSTLSQVPSGISHSHFGSFTYVPHTANPHYEHYSSVNSHYDPHTADPWQQ